MEKRAKRKANVLGKMTGEANPLPRLSVAIETFGTNWNVWKSWNYWNRGIGCGCAKWNDWNDWSYPAIEP
jgi:hypothetical protein